MDEEKRYESKELLYQHIKRIVDARLTSQRHVYNDVKIPIGTGIRIILTAPFYAAADMWNILNDRDEGRKKYKLRERFYDWLKIVADKYHFGWNILFNQGPLTDEQWREIVDEEVQNTVLHIRSIWLDCYYMINDVIGGAVVVVDNDTMLPQDVDQPMDGYKTVKRIMVEGLQLCYGMSFDEFVEILKDIRRQLPDDLPLPNDLMDYLVEDGVAVFGG